MNKVSKVTLSEAKQAADTLYKAFKDDPFTEWLTVTSENNDHNGRELFETWVKYGVRYGLVFRTEQFESVAIRRKPGDTNFSKWKLFRSGMFKTPRLLGKVGMKRLEMLESLCTKAKKEMMLDQKYWHCWILGTKPDKQGQGFGKLLMSTTFQLAKTDNLPCYLETTKNSKAEKVHLHLGYKPLRTMKLPDSDISLTTMVCWPD